MIDLPDATGGPITGPADGASADGQVAEHWQTPDGVFELRWPPDPQELFGTAVVAHPEYIALYNRFGGSSLSGDGRTLVVGDSSNPTPNTTFTMTLDTPPSAWQRPCDRVQVRQINADGGEISLIYQFGSGTGFGTEALVEAGAAHERAQTPEPGFTVECTTTPQVTTAVADAPVSPTPPEALRDLLASPAGAPLDLPIPSRMSTQYHVAADDKYWFEHYTEWDQHLAVVVERASGGWQVTRWATGKC